MNGILNILKPTGMTSHDVVGQIRRKFEVRKAGHTGTLDPNAAGVLPVCIGRATKLSRYLTEKDKRYRCEMIFGKTTDTLDSYGQVTAIDEDIREVSEEMLTETVNRFVGEIEQIPPAYSAIKVGGKKLYEAARKGKEVGQIPARKVRIHEISLLRYEYPKLVMDIVCSKGTYIRSLVRDIAAACDRNAYMSLLIRMQAGPFKIEDAVTLEELETKGIEEHLVPLPEIVFAMEDVILKSTAEKSYLNGCAVSVKGIRSLPKECTENVRVFGEQGEFFGIGKISETDGECSLKSETLLITADIHLGGIES